MVKKHKLDLNELEEELLKEYGEEFITRGKNIGIPDIIPTGILSVDNIIGGGIPKGRITEIYGPPASSKSLLSYCFIASAQKQGGRAVLIDVERTFEAPWAEKNGVNVEDLVVVRPTTGEEAYEVLLKYVEAGVDIAVIDSIANVVPNAELEGSMSDANIGLAARLNAKAMRKLTISNRNTAVILINQIRANVSTGPYMGSPETTSGGKAIPFYASIRFNLRRIGSIKKSEEVVGNAFRLRVEKAKSGGTKVYKIAQFEVDLNNGIDIAKDILQHALAKNLVKKAGSWYTIGEERRQGESAIKEYIIESGLMDQWRKEFTNDNNSD